MCQSQRKVLLAILHERRMAKKKQKTDDETVDFEEALLEVEQIVAKLESGEAGLTDSLGFYETGIKRLRQCHALLHDAERRITLLSGFDADGNPVTDEFQVDDSEPKTANSRAKTSRKTGGKPKSRKTAPKGDSDSEDASVDDSPGLF